MTIATMISLLAQGFGTTLAIFFLTLIGSLPLGLLVYFGKVSRIAPLRWLVNFYISIMRGTPLMLQIMVIYFAPNLIFGLPVPQNWRFWGVIAAFIINYAAYFAEIYRGGIGAISKGQYEAAQVLGYTKAKTFVKIILPQMIKNVLPSVTNEVITLVKDTSLAYAIGTVEIFTRTKQIAVAPNLEFPGMLAFAVAAVFYYIFNTIVAFAMERCEKALDYYR